MKTTKRMADSMEMQTSIMQQVFEQSIGPILKPNFQRSGANDKEGRFFYIVNNLGKTVFYLKEVTTKIWNEDAPEVILNSHTERINKQIAPYPDQLDVNFVINFSPSITQIYQNFQKRKKIKFQSVFIVEDVKKREHEFKDSIRTLY